MRNNKLMLTGLATLSMAAVALAHRSVESFGSTGVIPDVSTKPIQQQVQAGKTVTLEGTVNPHGTTLTACQVEYGPTPSYEQSAPCTSTPTGESTVSVTANVVGPLPGTLYHYRFDAANANGSNQGADKTFITPGTVEDQSTVASEVAQLTTTLNATINPGVLPTSYHFEYGTTSAYGSVAPNPDLYPPTGEKEQLSQTLTGLQPGMTYHFAIVINDAAGTFTGPDATFTTTPVPQPTVSTGGSSAITESLATLAGAIDPHAWNTTYHFQYGTSTAYGSSWPTVDTDMGALTGAQPVTITVQKLQPATTYHYRLVATNPGGTTYGTDQAFTTNSYPVSIIQAAPVGAPLGIAPAETTKPKSTTHKHKKSKPKKPKNKKHK
jgi:hypothetical protein